MRARSLILCCALAAGVAWAQHEHHGGEAPAPATPPPASPPGSMKAWTRLPLLASMPRERGERAAAVLRPVNIEVEDVTVFAPDGPADRAERRYPVAGRGAKIESAAPGVGNYHWVVARQDRDGEVRTASTAWYFSNPGAAPTAMLRAVRHELEIVPAPLPREHGNYRESEKWRFLVRLRGAPVADQPVMLETGYGSRSTFVTDAAGYATVVFPRDFRPAPQGAGEAGHSGPRRADFVLGTEKEADGKRFLTAFNHTYSPDPDRSRSLGWGAAFGLLGMVAAMPLLRRRSPANHQGNSHV